MSVATMRIAERPHFTIAPYNLAAWIADQGENVWWTVDGDPLLMSRLDFPCPPEEIAAELQRHTTRLLVADPQRRAGGEELTPEEFGHVTEMFRERGDPLFLSWETGEVDWLLAQDKPLVDE
jgi:hypothetical protein